MSGLSSALAEPFLNREPPTKRSLRPSFALLLMVAVVGGVAIAVLRPLRQSPNTSFHEDTTLHAEIWETREHGPRLQKMNQLDAAGKRPTVILRVTPTEQYQSIRGFGAAITQASGTVWQSLQSESLRHEVINAYFGSDGINATMARVPINSCDFSEKGEYSFDDVPGDVQCAHFDKSLREDERSGLIPMARAALSANPSLEFLASPWSPPAWMKSNGAMNGNGKPRGLLPAAEAAWALYISTWLGAFSAHGLNVSLLTVQNEPQAPSPWEACWYDAPQEAAFVSDHLGPALAEGVRAGRHPSVGLLGFDDQKDRVQEWSEVLMGEQQPSAPWLAGVAYHWYAGDHFDRLAAAASSHPERLFLGTEATYELTRLGDDAQPGSAAHTRWVREGIWARGEGYAHAIIGDLLAGSGGWCACPSFNPLPPLCRPPCVFLLPRSPVCDLPCRVGLIGTYCWIPTAVPTTWVTCAMRHSSPTLIWALCTATHSTFTSATSASLSLAARAASALRGSMRTVIPSRTSTRTAPARRASMTFRGPWHTASALHKALRRPSQSPGRMARS